VKGGIKPGRGFASIRENHPYFFRLVLPPFLLYLSYFLFSSNLQLEKSLELNFA